MSIGFVGSKTADVEALLSNFRLTEVVIGERGGITPEETFKVEAANNEGNIIVSWTASNHEGLFDVQVSTDGQNFASVGTVEDASEFVYIAKEDAVRIYIKVIHTNDSKVEESNIVSVLLIDLKDKTDTDGDGLTDVFEKYQYKTDSEKVDTDMDGLTDFEEIFYTHTDPLVSNSFDPSVSDSEADMDNDGLTNIEEIANNTFPKVADSDSDGITDGDEVKFYGTNPLVADTDSDGIIDGDELKLGLDPNNPCTFGDPDSEHILHQTIGTDSPVLSGINVPESPYKISLEIDAAGCVESSLDVRESRYSTVISNDAILGVIPELNYDNSNIGNVKISFKIDDKYVDNSLNLFPDSEEITGLKHLCIFKYFENINMLLPIETFYDETNNVIYSTVDELGTYCVMDFEKWLNNLYQKIPSPSEPMSIASDVNEYEFTEEETRVSFSNDEESSDIEDTSVSKLKSREISINSPNNDNFMVAMAESRSKVSTPVDVVFLLQTSGREQHLFEPQKAMIVDVMDKLINAHQSNNIRFCVIAYNLSGASIATPNTWVNNSADLKAALDSLSYTYTTNYTNRGSAFSSLLSLQTQSDFFRKNSAKFIFQVMNGSTTVGDGYFDQINTRSQLGINYSELMPEGYYYIYPSYGQQVNDAIASTKGINITYGSNSANTVYNHIIQNSAPPQVKFSAITAIGWDTIVLDDVLDKFNDVDTDDDSITDWDEVDTNKLKWDNDGTVILPSLSECMTFAKKSYSEDGIKQYKADQWESGMPDSAFQPYLEYIFSNTFVLPILSDPTKRDSDLDGIPDPLDSKRLEKDDVIYQHINEREYEIADMGETVQEFTAPETGYYRFELTYDYDDEDDIQMELFDGFGNSITGQVTRIDNYIDDLYDIREYKYMQKGNRVKMSIKGQKEDLYNLYVTKATAYLCGTDYGDGDINTNADNILYKDLFKAYGFDVVMFEGNDFSDIYEYRSDPSKYPYNHMHDEVVVISSHGEPGFLQNLDGSKFGMPQNEISTQNIFALFACCYTADLIGGNSVIQEFSDNGSNSVVGFSDLVDDRNIFRYSTLLLYELLNKTFPSDYSLTNNEYYSDIFGRSTNINNPYDSSPAYVQMIESQNEFITFDKAKWVSKIESIYGKRIEGVIDNDMPYTYDLNGKEVIVYYGDKKCVDDFCYKIIEEYK